MIAIVIPHQHLIEEEVFGRNQGQVLPSNLARAVESRFPPDLPLTPPYTTIDQAEIQK